MMSWIRKQKNRLALKILFIVFALSFGSCSSWTSCVKVAGGSSAKPPCWLKNTQKKGIVVQGDRGIRSQSEAKLALLNEAILEFAKAKYGVEVKLNSQIEQKTTLRESGGKENIAKNTKQVYIGEFSTAKEIIPIKVKIRDYYYEPRIEKMWVWAEEVK